jgi:hypothetical protein
MKQLGEKGLEMIWASMKYPELRGCWAEIGKPKTSSAISFTFPLMLSFLFMITSVTHVNLQLVRFIFFDCKLRSHRICNLHILWEIS